MIDDATLVSLMAWPGAMIAITLRHLITRAAQGPGEAVKARLP